MKKIIALFLSLTLFLSFGALVHAEEYTEQEKGYDTTLQLIDLFAITDKTNDEIMEEALLSLAKEDDETFYRVLNALAKTVDEYSMYYSEEEWEEFSKSYSGVVCGIGVTAIVNNGVFEVVTVLDGGSAKEGGIVPGDRIIEADGVDITGDRAENATSYITGEEGTFVKLKVKKASGEIKEYTLERRVVVVPSVEAVIEGDIGYILINSFTNNTDKEVEKELINFKNNGIEKLIIDLRYNGGGVMDAGINTAKLFMKKDKVVISTKGKAETENNVYKTDKDGYDFKTVILTNEYTASAAEIMACALIDNGYAVSVGKTTYGKACAQALYPLSVGGALRLTVLNYYTPNGTFINKEGIKVTHFVENGKYKIASEDLPKLTFTNKYKAGDFGEEVEKIETMLYDLGYLSQKPDTSYDENTMQAVKKYQEAVKLYPYGVCDLTTQNYLITSYSEVEFTEDTQLKYAKELLNK